MMHMLFYTIIEANFRKKSNNKEISWLYQEKYFFWLL